MKDMTMKIFDMGRPHWRCVALSALALVATNLYADDDDTELAQQPLFVSETSPPLNMLVMGRDHKLYYEAYNDASDLDGDGVLDIGYKPDKINYYGYFNNKVCYTYNGSLGAATTVAGADGRFVPSSKAGGSNGKKCSGAWSGDFLNYVATSRMDALRKVLYGGWRTFDSGESSQSTVLQAAYIPRDAHSWAKAYEASGESYNINDYTPLATPQAGTRHLFAVTSLRDSGDEARTQLRVLDNTTWQIWDWVSQETNGRNGSAGQDTCGKGSGGINVAYPCERSGGEEWMVVAPDAYKDLTLTIWKAGDQHGKRAWDSAGMNMIFNTYAKDKNKCGSGSLDKIMFIGESNPFSGNNGCGEEWFIARITGKIYIEKAGDYSFSMTTNDSSEVTINGKKWGLYHSWDASSTNWEQHQHGTATGDNGKPAKKIHFSAPGWYNIQYDFVKYDGLGRWGLAWKIKSPKSQIKGYNVKVEVCPAGKPQLHEDNCKPYTGRGGGSPIYQPTGLLHDFGESDRMYFGLLTGSYAKNVAGGVLRTNMSRFKREIDRYTGQLYSDGDGIVANINRLKLVGFDGRDSESRYYGQSGRGCPWVYNKPLSQFLHPEDCDMWGNPIAEMMFETLRYFSGAAGGHSQYTYGGGSRDDALGLSKPQWKHPYTTLELPYCARPVMTVFSDINPSFDFKLPGSRYQSIDAGISGNPLSGLNVAKETDAIGAAEGIHGKKFFIGQTSESNADAAPTVKTVGTLSMVRGLSPQEPSRQGTYYAAGVARFGARNKIAGNSMGMNPVMTYSIALASPLPEIRFPIAKGSNKYVTLAPFAKTIGSSSPSSDADDVGAGNLQATNQLVDFYVEKIANTGASDEDPSVNEGRPYAKFRINYEDIEQGADHDMDMMVIYTVKMEKDGQLSVALDSSTQAFGWAIQHAGYVISGTTKDGVYMEVRDADTPINDSRINKTYYTYRYNTPPGRDPGYCKNKPKQDPECKILPLQTERKFTVSSSGSDAKFLKDPLWYAAKYGIPGRDPGSVIGDPDNYFLVTNATTLKDQLTRAFNSILQASSSVTAPAVDIPSGPLTGDADVYRTIFDVESGWSGDVIKDEWKANPTGVPGEKVNRTPVWSAAEQLAQNTNRKIFFAGKNGLKEFTWSNVSSDSDWSEALNKDPESGNADGKAQERVAFLRGENEVFRNRPLLPSGKPNILGDIVNSSPLRVRGPAWQVSQANRLEGNDKYTDFAKKQAQLPQMLYVGANDGMLHAFNADTGEEVFAFIPSALRKHLNKLTDPGYGMASWGAGAHRYFVDGTPVVADAYFANAWHKVLLGSLGAGGRQVFALDITDPTNPKLLWEFGSAQDKAMGHSVPEPMLVRLNDRASGKWVALVPGGYEHEAEQNNASLFVLDVSNGTVLKKFSMNGGEGISDDSTLPEAYLPLGNGLSNLAVLDSNVDGMTDVAYAGDLLGNLWRFDLKSKSAANWKVEKLFVAKDADGVRQPITAPPYVQRHPTGEGHAVVFGTGRFVTWEDQGTWQMQSVYSIWDQGDSATESVHKNRSHLQIQEFEEFADAEGVYHLTNHPVKWWDNEGKVKQWGWVFDFPMEGEKLIFKMRRYGEALLISTLNPNGSVADSLDSCSAGLGGMLYAIDPENGGALKYPVFDRNDDGLFDDSDMICEAGACTPPSGIGSDGGRITLGGGFGYGGGVDKGKRTRLNSGTEDGRQSWREQPPNSK